MPLLPPEKRGPDGWDARLPIRWPWGEIGKIPMFIVSVAPD
jgi:hypothetical protein